MEKMFIKTIKAIFSPLLPGLLCLKAPGKRRNYKLLSPAMRAINVTKMSISPLCPGSFGVGISIDWYIMRKLQTIYENTAIYHNYG